MKKLQRGMTVACLTAIFVFVLAACGGAAKPAGEQSSAPGGSASATTKAPAVSDNGKKVLNIMYQYSGDANKNAVEAMIAKYKEKYPNAQLNVQGLTLSNFYTVLQTRVSTKDYPDVVFATPAVIPSYAAAGVLADLTPYLPADFFKTFSDVRTSVDRPNNTIVGSPLTDSPRAIIYNKTALDKAGIKAPGVDDAPWTWEQMVDVAKQLQEKKVVRYGLMFEKPSFDGWMPFLYQNGGALTDGKGNTIINNEASVAAIDWTVKLHKDGIAAPGIIEGTDDPVRLFTSGQVGLWLSSGAWNIPTLEQQIKEFKYSVTYMPTNVNGTGIPGGVDIMAFKTDHVKDSAEFIQFVASPEIVTILSNAVAGFPPRSDVSGIQFPREDLVPIFKKQAAILDKNLITDFFSAYYGKTKDQMLRELQSAVIGQQTPKQAADKMADILKKEVKP